VKSEGLEMKDNKRPLPWGLSKEYERLVTATGKARLRYFRTLGEPDVDVWAPVINPIFQGGPAWPTRPAWQPIRNGNQTLIASSGLSDPSGDAEAPNLGFGIETIVTTTDAVGENLHHSWAFELARMISHHAAADGRFDLRHAKFGLFLFGVPTAIDDYRDLADEEGYLGFLLGLPIPGVSMTFSLPSGTATLLTAKVLTRVEYRYAAGHGPEGSQRLGELFQQDGSHHVSSLERSSVV
jgi:hypothetical protein